MVVGVGVVEFCNFDSGDRGDGDGGCTWRGRSETSGIVEVGRSIRSRARWQTFGDEIFFGSGGLVIGLKQKGDYGGAVTTVEASSQFTIEAAAAQANGELGAFYGILFNYRDAAHYSAVLINGNGYVEVFEKEGKVWMPQQEWPNILLGNESNRVRLDVAKGEGLISVLTTKC